MTHETGNRIRFQIEGARAEYGSAECVVIAERLLVWAARDGELTAEELRRLVAGVTEVLGAPAPARIGPLGGRSGE